VPEFEIMLVVESSVTYTIEADTQADAIEEAEECFSPSDVDWSSGCEIREVLVETTPGSRHFTYPS
jgi:hypothetical protein